MYPFFLAELLNVKSPLWNVVVDKSGLVSAEDEC